MEAVFTNFWFLLFTMITITGVVASIAGAWAQMTSTRAKTELKMQMIQRGMSAQDIERVLTCASNHDTPPPGPAGIDGNSLNELVAVLAENETSAKVIEQVLMAFRTVDEPTQRLVSEAVQNLLSSADEVEDEQILAVVRPLCQPKEAPGTVPFARSEAFHA